MRLRLDRFASPIGDILLATDEDGAVRALDFHDYEDRMRRLLRLHYGAFDLRDGRAPASVTVQLAGYFAGEHTALALMPVATAGTDFQRRVWAALRTIPAGVTATYGRIATLLGKPGASRAVGFANGANPVAIIVPCHRVIGANAALTGFGGGLHRKRWLLEHEGVSIPPNTNRQKF